MKRTYQPKKRKRARTHGFRLAELRSFYRYVKSLGEPGMPAPAYVEPGVEPITPYIAFEPQMPAQSQ